MEGLKKHLLILCVYSVLAIIATYPLIANLDSTINYPDTRYFIWTLWWWKHSLVDLHTNPFYTDYLCYPYGISLYFQNAIPVLGLVSIPLQLVLGVNATFNILLLASFVLSAYGMYLLCRYLTGNEYAALAGGVFFAFSPFRFRWMSMGWLNLMSCQWIPFYVLYLIKSAREGRGRDMIIAGIFLALSGLTHLEFIIFTTFLTIIILLYVALVEKKAFNALKTAVGVYCLFLLLTAVVLVPTLMESLQSKYPRIDSYEIAYMSPDVMGVFIPDVDNPFLGELAKSAYIWETMRLNLRISYVGYVIMALAAYVTVKRRDRHVLLWVFAALFFYWLSLGPIVQYMGRYTDYPSLFSLIRKIPMLGFIRFVNKFTLMTSFCLSIAASYGMGELTAKRGMLVSALLLSAATVLFVSESILPVNLVDDLPDEPAYSAISASGGSALHIPFKGNLYYLIGKRDVKYVNCNLQRTPVDYMNDSKFADIMPAVKRIQAPQKWVGQFNARSDLPLLKSYDVGYITAEKGYYKKNMGSLFMYMSAMNATLVGEDEKVMVFRLPG